MRSCMRKRRRSDAASGVEGVVDYLLGQIQHSIQTSSEISYFYFMNYARGDSNRWCLEGKGEGKKRKKQSKIFAGKTPKQNEEKIRKKKKP